MPIRNQSITPYNSSSSGTYDKHEKEPSVKVSTNVSNFKKSPISDSLYKALKHAPSLPKGTHAFAKRAVKPSGANYKPSQEYGSLTNRRPSHNSTYTYGKAPGGKGENANPGKGRPDGRGRSANANPSGGPSNAKGSNANMYPRIANRPGTNANPGKGKPDGRGRSGNALANALRRA